ncbi:MAG: LuxR C-terminal-related transcriptional regulator [Treponema sp.]|jgi:LuxR family maltose regulon positive regulatory protein|nr:LuxR C-terminal-related transcriptional regulator [Treponema sp.]
MDNSNPVIHFNRPRLNQLFMEAIKYPLIIVCAGAGYGKTSAVLDFIKEYKALNIWIQLSEKDNIGSRFWENCANTMAPINKALVDACVKLGFPDTPEKVKQYMELVNTLVDKKRRLLIFDDFHYIQEPSVIRFLEECVIHRMPPGTSILIISRSSPQLNIANMISKGYIYNITENDLRFTENELAQYFNQLDLYPDQSIINEIIQDTEGWVFAINLIAHSYKKAPGYNGYLRNAMKFNIFKLMETEIWNEISPSLQTFLIRLSLIEHLSTELISLLAGKEKNLIKELEKQTAYIRQDQYINAYLIHPLFLDFLKDKQKLLSEKQKKETYSVTGEWCNKNGFKMDALSYYEKIGDYKSIASILYALPPQIPRNIVKFAADILDRAPKETAVSINNFASMHLSTYMGQGLWEDALKLAERYEKLFLKLPKGNPFKNQALSTIYNSWGYLRILMSIKDDIYDFDKYFIKYCKHIKQPLDMIRIYNHGPGPWINGTGTSRKGAPQEFIDALKRSTDAVKKHLKGFKPGDSEIAMGELNFYRGNLSEAETDIIMGLEQARECKQYEIMHRGLFYMMRLSFVQGNYEKLQTVLREIKSHLEETVYLKRHINYDITMCWYYCLLGMPDKVPAWLKEGFSPYGHAAFIENFANQMKAWYCLATRNYPSLLSYIQELKQRESYLYGRIEMFAMEACVHYKMKNTQKALVSLKDAYSEAHPNELLMPFIELGKDMRTLSSFALKKNCGIPKAWLETVNRKSASYAKRQAHIITHYKQEHSISDISISPREAEVIADLSHGLSRTEIAANRGLSINTIKMIINRVYMKLGAENLADAIRIATRKKIL